jgi:U3 small nucleolar RNA-associated protein 23
MRHGRAKAARKTLQFFARQGICPPYTVILDGTFLLASVLQKVPLFERLDRMLQHHTFYLKVTRSCLDELAVLAEIPSEKQDALRQARQWGLDECQILEQSDIPKEQQHKLHNEEEKEQSVVVTDLGVAGQDIVKLVVSSSSNVSYLVATQDEALLDLLRNRGMCPLLRLSRGVLLLENPSKACQRRADYQDRSKYLALTQERSLAHSVKEEEREQQQQRQLAGNVRSKRVKKKAKGPNPLSCKRKSTQGMELHVRKRKRTRKGNKVEESAST